MPAPRRRALIAAEIESRKDIANLVRNLKFIEANASPALLRKMNQGLKKIADAAAANPRDSK
jgi:hypothetical protein